MRKIIEDRIKELEHLIIQSTAEVEVEKEEERNRVPEKLKKVTALNALNIEKEALESLLKTAGIHPVEVPK